MAGNENKCRTTQKLQTMRMRGRENTKRHADVWEWSEPDVTKLSIKKQQKKNKSCIRAELNLVAQDWHFASVPNTTLHPTKYGRKENNWAIVPRFNAWHRVHGQNHANIHLFRVSGIETGRGKTMAKCLCYWITKADSWLFAFTRSHSALIAKWWKPHCYKGHCFKRHWLCVGEQEIL